MGSMVSVDQREMQVSLALLAEMESQVGQDHLDPPDPLVQWWKERKFQGQLDLLEWMVHLA